MQLLPSNIRPQPRQVQVIRQRYRVLITTYSVARAYKMVTEQFFITKEVLDDIMTLRFMVAAPKKVKEPKPEVDVEAPLNNRKSSFVAPKEKQSWLSLLGN